MDTKTHGQANGLEVRRRTLAELTLDPRNARSHGEANMAAIVSSLQRFGQAEPLVVQAGTGRVIGGNGRLVAMRQMGWNEADVVEVQLSDEEAKALGIALNRTAELAEWDERTLADLLVELRDDEALGGTGFDGLEIDRLLSELEAGESLEAQEDEGPDEVPDTPVSRRGDLWILGSHRLLCGDATSSADLERLMDGQVAALLATDPPYLVDYKGAEQTNGNHWDDFHGDESAVAFFSAWLQACLPWCRDDVPVYQWHATRRQALVEAAWKANGLLVHQTVVWAKPRGTLGRSHFMWAHEPCFYGWREGMMPRSPRTPDPAARTVWEIDHGSELEGDHPTQKPVEVFTRPMGWHTLKDEVCLEPFSGSGSQLVAAEQGGRRCFALELDPRYVDVAVRRWERAAGAKAVLDSGGAFDEVAAERGQQ